MTKTVEVTRTYLEMLAPEQIRPAKRPIQAFEIRQVRQPAPEFCRFLYTAIGGAWYWIDRLPWNYADWVAFCSRPEVETWVGYEHGTPAGFFELAVEPGPEVQIQYFGLLPGYMGRGLGGTLLTRAAQRAWELGPRRVWVHTCTLDGPTALANYEARGFRVYNREVFSAALPDTPPGPWPGAQGATESISA